MVIVEYVSPLVYMLRNMTNNYIFLGSVLKDLCFPNTLQPIVLSEEGVEKPALEIFAKTLELVNRDKDLIQNPIHPKQCLHIGDELMWSVMLACVHWKYTAEHDLCEPVIIMVQSIRDGMLCYYGGPGMMENMSIKMLMKL